MGVKRAPVAEPAQDARVSETEMWASFSHLSAPPAMSLPRWANSASMGPDASILRCWTLSHSSPTLSA